jgi:hypothetical protein
MLKNRHFTTTLLSFGLAASLAGWSMAQAAEPAPPAAKPAESQPEQAAPPAKQEWLFANGEHWSKAADTEKRAYVLGILNMAMVEYQLSGPSPKPHYRPQAGQGPGRYDRVAARGKGKRLLPGQSRPAEAGGL